ncbi:MAG: hypothetical protein H0Z37_09970 [Firmicutes bacterium]|nr:hypothetical protein [Bacillota bacterium]
MTTAFARSLPAVWLALLAAAAAGCRSPFPPLGPDTGQVVLSANLSSLAASDVEPETAEISLTQDRHRVERRAPVQDGKVSVTVENLYVGVWNVHIAVVDHDGDTVFAGGGTVYVEKDKTTTASVVLAPQPGRLRLTIDIAGLPLEAESYKARLHLSSGQTYDLERVPGTARFEADVEADPGSYDFKVDFYADSFHSYKMVYSGYWVPVTVLPGKTAAVLWRPGTGQVIIDAGPAGPPPPPPNLTARWEDGLIFLQWDPAPDTSVIAYRIYRKHDPLGRYELHAEVDQGTTSLADSPPDDPLPPGQPRAVYYVVTAVNEASSLDFWKSPES